MDTRHPNTEKYDQPIVAGQAKSYTCSFCKKGFSNAQALGGHMNVHRKDRAKLRESSEDNETSSMEIVKTTTAISSDDFSQVSEFILESSEDKGSSPCNRPTSKVSRENNANNEVSSSRSSKGQMELDLELRLWSEPNQDRTERKNTRQFF